MGYNPACSGQSKSDASVKRVRRFVRGLMRRQACRHPYSARRSRPGMRPTHVRGDGRLADCRDKNGRPSRGGPEFTIEVRALSSRSHSQRPDRLAVNAAWSRAGRPDPPRYQLGRVEEDLLFAPLIDEQKDIRTGDLHRRHDRIRRRDAAVSPRGISVAVLTPVPTTGCARVLGARGHAGQQQPKPGGLARAAQRYFVAIASAPAADMPWFSQVRHLQRRFRKSARGGSLR
jgi:hypothetical protein